MKSQKLFPLLLVALMLLPLVDLIKPGLPITHDGQDHVARIANFYQGLQEGIIIPRWAGNLNWGYGHPILMFLYPLPSYFASLIHFMGFSFVDSTKIVFGLSFIFSGLAMYLWLKEFLTREQAFVGGMFYVFAPYRFVDLYVRGAIGEHVAFIFPPLVLYFLFKLSKKNSYWNYLGGVLSLAGLLLAHNAISLMFLPLIIFYLMFLLWQTKHKKSLFFTSCFVILTGFALAAFFWMPAFFEGKYTLRDIVTGDGYKDRFSDWIAFVYGHWNYGISGDFTVQVGILQWLAVFVSIPLTYLFYKKKNKLWIFSGVFVGVFFLTLFIMNWSSQILWEHISIIQKFQFPWRFLSVTVFVSAVLGAFAFSLVPKKYVTIGVSLFVLCILFFNSEYWHAQGYQQKPEKFYTSIFNGTTDTGESAPIWSIRFMEQRPHAAIEALDGEIVVKEIKRTSIRHHYIIEAKKKSLLRENTVYFPGWELLIDGKIAPVEFQDPNNRGLMTFSLEKGDHTVVAQFVDTKLRELANAISVVGLFLLIVLGILRKKLW